MTKVELKIEEFLTEHFIQEPEVTFSTYVFQKVDEMFANCQITKESQVYLRGNIDRRVYSNLKKADKNFKPYKSTALSFCIALGLTVSEAEELLKLAGHQFEDTNLTDQVVKCCLSMGIYSADEVNGYINEFAEKYGIEKVMYLGSFCRKDRVYSSGS